MVNSAQICIAAHLLLGLVQAKLFLQDPVDRIAELNEWVPFNCTLNCTCLERFGWFMAGHSNTIRNNGSITSLTIMGRQRTACTSGQRTFFITVLATEALNKSAIYCGAVSNCQHECSASRRCYSRPALLLVKITVADTTALSAVSRVREITPSTSSFPTKAEATLATETSATTDTVTTTEATETTTTTATVTYTSEATLTTESTATTGTVETEDVTMFLLKVVIPLAVVTVAVILTLVMVIHLHLRHMLRNRRASKGRSNPHPMVPNPIYEGPVYETIDPQFQPLIPCRDTPNYPAIESNSAAVLNVETVLPLNGNVTAAVSTDTILSNVRSEDNYVVMHSARATAVPVQPANNDNNTT